MSAPNPSTVPIRVSAAIIGSATPRSMSRRAWATFGYWPGQVDSGTSSSGVPNVAVWFACQAAIAGTRWRVRGDTYRPSPSKPPWQTWPPAINGASIGESASSSSAVYSSCAVVMSRV